MTSKSYPILIGIGSNIDPAAHIPQAVEALQEVFGPVRTSTFYWSRPLLGRRQPPYLNGVVAAETALTPGAVRHVLAEVENRTGRQRDPRDRYASRTLDLDLLLYGDMMDDAHDLPNPDLLERDFVLIPAAELMPNMIHPKEKCSLRDLARNRFPETTNIEAPAELPGLATRAQPKPARRARPLAVLLFLAFCALAGCTRSAIAREGFGSMLYLAAMAPSPGFADSAQGKPKGRSPLRSLLTIVVGSYLGLCAYMFVSQSRFIYFPTRELTMTPGDARMDFEDLRLTAGNGEIHAWYVPAAGPERGTILFCHGNGGNIGHRIGTLQILKQLGFSTLIFDYRGYGQSTGRPGEKRSYEDAEAAWHYLTSERGIPAERIVIFGRSLGGAIAAWTARKHTPGALVLESSFTSVPDLGQQVYPFIPVRLLSLFRYNTAEYVAQVQCPVIVLHSPDDDIIPYSHGRALYAAAPEPKQFIEMVGTHNEGFLMSGESYTKGLDLAFAEAGFPQPPPSNPPAP